MSISENVIAEVVTNEANEVSVKEVPRYKCKEQSYGVDFKLKTAPILISVDIYGDGELELTESEIKERALKEIVEAQRHVTPELLEFEHIEVYNKDYVPVEKTYEKQVYYVKYRMQSGGIQLSINVEFFNQPKVSDDDIKAAAYDELAKCFEIEGLCYFEDIYDQELIEAPEPTFPYLHSVRPDDEREELSDEEMIGHLIEMGYTLTGDDGEISTLLLSDVAANSEGFKWDDDKNVWYK